MKIGDIMDCDFYHEESMTCVKIGKTVGNMVEITVKSGLLKYIPSILTVLSRGF